MSQSLSKYLMKFFRLRSLKSKLLVPILGLMIISLLGSTLTFLFGTALTQRQLLKQQAEATAKRISEAISARVHEIDVAAELLANDPAVMMAIQATQDTETALETLNQRAVVIRDRFGVDLIQIYNASGETRTNLLLSALYRESSLLEEVQNSEAILHIIQGRVLLLKQAEIYPDTGHVVVGIDLETELQRLAAQYRLNSNLGVKIDDTYLNDKTLQTHIATVPDFPFDAHEGRSDGMYSRHVALEIGNTGGTLIIVQSTTDIRHITTLGITVMTISTLVTTGLLLGLSVLIAHAIAHPIQQLSNIADTIAKGYLNKRVNVQNLESWLNIGEQDEIGVLAKAFNSMVGELQNLYANLEAKVSARTQELAMTAEIARAVSSSLDMDIVLQMSTHLIRTRLGFHNVSIFTIEPESKVAVLQESTYSMQTQHEGHSISLAPNILISTSAMTQSPCVVPDVHQDTKYLKTWWLPETQSAAAIPIISNRTVIGVLEVQSESKRAFPPEIINLLTTLSDQISVGLQNAKLYRLERKRRRFAEVLELTGRVLSGSLDMEEVPARVLSMLNTLVAYERGSLWLQEGEVLKPLARYGYPKDNLAQITEMPICDGDVYHKLVKARKPLIIADVTQEPGWTQAPGLPLNHSWLGVPIVSKGRVIGFVSLTQLEPDAFTSEDAALLESFAMQAGIALENARLYAEIAQFNEHLENMVATRTQELNKAYAILEKLDATKSSFINVAAHELRTPLTVIIAYGQMLRQVLDVGDPLMQRAIGGILDSSKRLQEIVNSMLDMAKIDNHVINIVKADINIQDLVRYIKINFEQALEDRQLILETVGMDALPRIQADQDLLHKVFYNLVNNAIKYTPDGGCITIIGSVDESNPQYPYVEIVVSDTGIGIDPDQQEAIFEKFYQTGEVTFHSSGRTKFKGGGPGLGLAIAKGIVQAHNGEIWVESECQDEERCPGSHFYVRLPLEKSAPYEQEVPAPVERAPLEMAICNSI